MEPAEATPHHVTRLFPFVLKTRALIIGRESLRANLGKLHFVLVTDDIAEEHRAEVLKDFSHYPVVQHFSSADLERFLNVKGARAVGFVKSDLAKSIYAELKEFRLNEHITPVKQPRPAPTTPPTAHKAA